MDDRSAWLRLATLPGVGPVGQRRLLKAFGGPAGVLSAGIGGWRRLLGTRAESIDVTAGESRFGAALAWLDGDGRRGLLCLDDESYPSRLLDLSDPPCAVFFVGEPALLGRPALAIVGSRAASAGGERNAEQFGEALSRSGICVVSGMALGIDGAAHRGGLRGSGSTIAVLGTGPDRVYPSRHRDLAHQIAGSGLLLSEFPPGVAPLAANFPRRNRLIAALGDGVLVVEAAVESGSLITARLAGELGREVFAVPGSIHSPQSRGCHRLIRDGAKLVETVDDISSEMRWRPRPAPAPVPEQVSGSAFENDKVLVAMGHDPCSVDQICGSLGLTGDAVLAILLELELSGRVFVRAGGYFQRAD